MGDPEPPWVSQFCTPTLFRRPRSPGEESICPQAQETRAPARHPKRSRAPRRPRAPRVHTRHGHDTKMAAGGTCHLAAGASSPQMSFEGGACTPRDPDALSSRLPSLPGRPTRRDPKTWCPSGESPRCAGPGRASTWLLPLGDPRGSQRTSCPSHESHPLISVAPMTVAPYLCCSRGRSLPRCWRQSRTGVRLERLRKWQPPSGPAM